MEYADTIKDMANETGLSIYATQQLTYMAEQTGASMNDVASAIKNVEKAMQQADNGTKATAAVFRELDISILDSNGHMRDAAQVFQEAISKLGELKNGTERSQMAMKLFGDSAKELNELTSLGKEGISELAAEFDQLGIALSTKDVEALSEAKQSIDNLKTSFMSAAAELAATVAPAIMTVTNFLANLSPEAKQVIMVVAALTAGLLALSLAIGAVGTIYSTMMATATATTQAFMTQAGPIIALIAALAALALAIKKVVDTYREWRELTGGSFGQFLLHPDGDFEGSKVGRNATGTQYWRGGLTWVGEEGPEIVEVPRGSRIYNNQQSTSIGGNTYNVSMNMDMTKIKKINDVIEAVEGLEVSAGCGR